MFSFRNGSLTANALLIAIGAAAGVGMTVLVAPLSRDSEASSNTGRASARGEAGRDHAANRKSGSSSNKDLAGDALNDDAIQHAAQLRKAGAEAATKDPANALLQVGSFDSEQDRLEFLRGIYSVWGASDPVAALEYAKSSLPAGIARSETIGIAVNKWASVDSRAAWMWSEANLSGPLKEQALTDVMIGWTRRTPAAAAQWLASTGFNSQPLINALARTWAEQDPKSAADWAKTLTQPEAGRTAKIAIASEWASQDPQAAADHFAPDINQPDGATLATAITNIWGTTDPAATSEWISKLPDGPGKSEAAATLAIVWSASDIQAAVAWSGSLSDEKTRRQVITHIGTTWGAIEPDGALNWLYSLPPQLAADGISGAFNSWAATDATSLREVVDASPPSAEMDQARMALGDILAATDIGSSLDLAAQLSTEKGRDDATARYFRHWRKTDDQSAQAWLTQNWSNLPTTTRDRLNQEQKRIYVSR